LLPAAFLVKDRTSNAPVREGMLRITLAAALVTLPVAARADVPAVTVGQPVAGF
jgi:hypothetical protein